MVIVTGHLNVEPSEREDYLAGCVSAIEAARKAPGCLDFAVSADLVDAGRVNVVERWESQEAVEAFRGDGPDQAQQDAVLSASVAEYDVTDERTLS